MPFLKILHHLFFLLSILLFSSGCILKNEDPKSNPIIQIDTPPILTKDTSLNIENNYEIKNDTITLTIIPCSNGYDYSTYGFDLNSLLEKRLFEEKNIRVIPFPLKKMKGSGYHGVFSKIYCSKILENVNVDFLIMTKMRGNLYPAKNRPNSWGYETKILSTKTLEEKKSISAKGLEHYHDIDKHIQKNITTLIKELDNLK